MQLRHKILLIYLFVILLGVALSSAIYVSGHQISTMTESLIANKLPRLQLINSLRMSIVEHERLLYEYYATTDRDTLIPLLTNTRSKFNQSFQEIEKAFSNREEINTVRYSYELIHYLANQLDNTLSADRVNWDEARELLVKISAAGRSTGPSLDRLIDTINNDSLLTTQATQSATRINSSLVAGFSLVIFAIAAFVGYYVNSYIRESVARRRLAMFPKRSPNPVLSLDWQGHITYANPATYVLLSSMGNHSQRPESILPSDFAIRLLHIQKSLQKQACWNTNIDQHTLSYTLSLFRDLNACHLYIEDITERTKAQQELHYQAFHDLLTELPNRRMFEEQVTRLIATRQDQHPFALMFINLDRFDLITASSGYDVGDQLIKVTANYLQLQIKQHKLASGNERLFRFDGTTFGLLLPDPINPRTPELFADQLQVAMELPLTATQQDFFLTLSIGISCFPHDGQQVMTLIKNADAALARVKSSGGDGVALYHADMHSKEQAWIAIESELRNAIENHHLQLYYQPKISTASGKLTGVEALLRCQLDDGKILSPAQFIPVAEQTGLIVVIGESVIKQAFKQCRVWSEYNSTSIAVNISARQFQHHTFIQSIENAVADSGVDPHLIELEITESILMQQVNRAIELMEKLKSMGFTLTVDDFGTGYSSLNYLRQFPIDKLKIDRSFVTNLADNDHARTLVHTIVNLAHNLELRTVAEGVETKIQLEILRQLGCEEIQGFYFSEPITAAEIERQYLSQYSNLRLYNNH